MQQEGFGLIEDFLSFPSLAFSLIEMLKMIIKLLQFCMQVSSILFFHVSKLINDRHIFLGACVLGNALLSVSFNTISILGSFLNISCVLKLLFIDFLKMIEID